MVSKLMVLMSLAAALCLATLTVADPEMLTGEEKHMIKETLEYFVTESFRTLMQGVRDRILKLHPQYLDAMTKLHVAGDKGLMFADIMDIMSYVTSVTDGNLCYVQRSLKSKDIAFGVDDMKNIGGVLVAGVKEQTPAMTPERAAQWDVLLAKVVAAYSKTTCPAE